jgi:hypothetical protein
MTFPNDDLDSLRAGAHAGTTVLLELFRKP